MLKSKISIVVPVYKVPDCLDRCMTSVINQTYRDLEIILVDDGSPDECPAMCDDWAQKDKRIRVIHKRNGGLSDARNAGIEVAVGDYLMFVDSDDYIEATMCEKMLTMLRNTQADIVVGNFYWEHHNQRKIQQMTHADGEVVLQKKILDEYFLHGSVDMVVAWNKLYSRDLFFTEERIRYPVGRLHEDEYTSYRLLYTARRIVFNVEPLYHYVQRNGSIMSNYNERNLWDTVACSNDFLKWADKYAPDKRKLLDYAAFKMCRMLILRCESTNDLSKYQKQLEGKVKLVMMKTQGFIFNPYANWKAKISYCTLRLGCYARLHRIFGYFRV